MDVTETDYTANCTADSLNILSCISTCRGSFEPNLVFYKSMKSSVTWLNPEEEDYSILRKANVELISVNYLYFEDNKWHFNVSTFLGHAKVIVDILYDNTPSTATCFGKKSHILTCTVNKESQSKLSLIQLKKEKPEGSTSTVTWINVQKDLDIPLYTELTFDKVDYLRFADGSWKFDAYIKDNDIPENALIIADIELLKRLGISNTKKMNSIANCIHNNKKLECSVIIERSDDDPYIYTPSLIKNKNPNSISSVIQWKEMTNDVTPIILTDSFDFYYANKIIQEEGQKYFYIELASSSKVPKNSKVLIDILIDDTKKISNCFGYNQTTLKCEIDSSEDITNKKVYIAKEKTSSSTLAWKNLQENQYLFSSKLTYIHAYNFKLDPTTFHYKFTIIAEGDETFKNNIIYPVKINRKVNSKIGSNIYDKIYYASCKNIDGFLLCDSARVFPEKDTYHLMLLASGDTVEWTNPDNYNIDEALSYVLYYKELLMSQYDETNKYYKYSFELTQSITSLIPIETIIMDLKINNEDSYGLCIEKKTNTKIIECHTPKLDKTDNDQIFIVKTAKYGNVDWHGTLNENIKIYPYNYITASVSKIYDLKFNSNKWEFKILMEDSLTLSEEKKVDILVDNIQNSASCTVSTSDNKILHCINDQATQNKDQLIKLKLEKNPNTQYIHLININHVGIPLIAQLEFINSSGLKYTNNNWSFTLKVKKTQNSDIPIGSTFSIDILYDTNKQELAFCTETARNSDILTLKCVPQNHLNEDNIIKLSNSVKSDYASVTWTTTISDDKSYIYLDLDLNVEYVSLPKLDNSGKYIFNMYISDQNLVSGTKAIIDILYNNQEATASCVLNSDNVFECSPDVTGQKEGDSFSIISTRKNGNINFKNDINNLKFIIFISYEKAYNLKFNSNKWSFNIKLLASNMNNGGKISIDISIDNNKNKAECTLNDNILTCQVNIANQAITNEVKIINNKNNEVFAWREIPDEVLLRLAYELIILIHMEDLMIMNGNFIFILTLLIQEIMIKLKLIWIFWLITESL